MYSLTTPIAGRLGGGDMVCTILNVFLSHAQHPDYDPTVFNVPNDVAVVQLASEADLDNEFIGLVTLPRSNDVFANNTNCWATGWGRYGMTSENLLNTC